MFIINAPFVFRAVWAMVKPWLHPITKERVRCSFLLPWQVSPDLTACLLTVSMTVFFRSLQIQLVGDNYKEKLLDLIDADQLPKELGGACDCSNEATCPKTQQVCHAPCPFHRASLAFIDQIFTFVFVLVSRVCAESRHPRAHRGAKAGARRSRRARCRRRGCRCRPGPMSE